MLKEFKTSVFITLGYTFFLYLTINRLPGFAFAAVANVIMISMLAYRPKKPIYGFMIFMLTGIFYYGFAGTIYFQTFETNTVAETLALGFNTTGPVLFAYMIVINRNGLKRLKWTTIDSLLMIYVISLVTSMIFARDFLASLVELRRYASFIVLYVLVRLIINDQTTIREFFAMAVGALLMLFFLAFGKALSGERYGTLGEFVFFLGPALFYVLYFALERFQYERWAKILAAVFLIGSVLLLVSESRRILLGVSSIWAFVLFRARLSKTFINLLIPLVLFMVLGGSLINTTRFEETITDSQEAFQEGEETDDEALKKLSTGRSELWQAGINMYIDNFFFGVGLANHVQLMTEYGAHDNLRVHNIVLDTATQLGSFGLFMFLWIIAKLWRDLSKNIFWFKLRGNRELAMILMGLQAGFFVLLVQAFLGGSMLFGKWGWLKVGILAAITQVRETDFNLLVAKEVVKKKNRTEEHALPQELHETA